MAYSVGLTQDARKDFDGLPSVVMPRVAAALRELQENPRPAGCKKLVNLGAWRVRVGDHRIIYTIDDAGQEVRVVKIKPRAIAYR
jgi:mRNA interferase RelE/StbE